LREADHFAQHASDASRKHHTLTASQLSVTRTMTEPHKNSSGGTNITPSLSCAPRDSIIVSEGALWMNGRLPARLPDLLEVPCDADQARVCGYLKHQSVTRTKRTARNRRGGPPLGDSRHAPGHQEVMPQREISPAAQVRAPIPRRLRLPDRLRLGERTTDSDGCGRRSD
jgi:hypothetical protein